MILGYIFAAVLVAIALWIVYHIVRGLVIGIDLMRWELIGIPWSKIRSTPNYKSKLVSTFLNHGDRALDTVGNSPSPVTAANGKVTEQAVDLFNQ